jgi:segregation and condensation protein B
MTTEDVVESKQEEQVDSQDEVSQTVPKQCDASEQQSKVEEPSCELSASDATQEESSAAASVELEGSEQGSSEQETSDQKTSDQPAEGAEQDQQGPRLSPDQQVGLLEALLLASGDPLPVSRVEELLGWAKADVLALAETLKQNYAAENRGLEVVNVSSRLQLRTKAIYAEYVRNLIAVKPRKLSQAALETLAVIAYQQPVVKSEVDKIRGVDVAPTIKTLLERKLVKILGYQASVGQPALYGTTEDFLSIFGLTSLAELPSLRDLKALVKEPGEALEVSEESEGTEEESVSPPPVEESMAENTTPVQ